MGMSCMRTFQAEHPVECLHPVTIPLDFDTLNEYGCFIGSAAIVVLSNQDTASGAARNVISSSPRNLAANVRRAASYRQGASIEQKRWDAS